MQCVECITHAQNSVSSTHYHVLSRKFLLTRAYLKSNIDHVVGVTCLFKFWRKKSHAPTDSILTTTKAIGKILLLSCCAIATRKIPLYLPYNHVLSTWTMSLQYWNPSIHVLKLQKRQWNMMKPSTAWPSCCGIGSVSFSMTISGRNCCIACNNLSKSWYNLS